MRRRRPEYWWRFQALWMVVKKARGGIPELGGFKQEMNNLASGNHTDITATSVS